MTGVGAASGPGVDRSVFGVLVGIIEVARRIAPGGEGSKHRPRGCCRRLTGPHADLAVVFMPRRTVRSCLEEEGRFAQTRGAAEHRDSISHREPGVPVRDDTGPSTLDGQDPDVQRQMEVA